jgi:hypothetical protein
MDLAGIFLFEKFKFGHFFRTLEGIKGVKVMFPEVLITNCPIHNLFAKKVLMLYNEGGLERYSV